jgi:hypothetical protein
MEPNWFASTLWRWNGAGDNDYRIGSEWTVHAGGSLPLHPNLHLLSQAVFRWSGSDDAKETGELVDATGGRAVFLSPGVRLRLTDGLSLQGHWQVPIYENVRRVQLTSGSNLLLGFSYELRL